MKSANEEIVRAAFAAWNRGDLDAAMEYIGEDIRWQTAGLFPGLEPVYEGQEGVRRFWEDFMAPWQTISIHPLEIAEPKPGRVVAHVRFQASGRQGIEVELEIWQLYRIRDGKLVHFETQPDRESAFAAAADA